MYGFLFFVIRTSRSSTQTGQGKTELPFKADIGSTSLELHAVPESILTPYLYVSYKAAWSDRGEAPNISVK